MSFKNEDFDVVYDKATLDTICSGSEKEKAISVLREVDRVLRPLGVYILVTLGQDSVLQTLTQVLRNKCYILKTYLVNEACELSKYPVFMMVWVKLDGSKDHSKFYDVMLSNNEPALHFKTFDEHNKCIKKLQQSFRYTAHIRKRYYPGSEFKVCVQQDSSLEFSYTFYIVDSSNVDNEHLYGVFVVPIGREVEWMYRTPEGRQYFAEMISYKRVTIVICDRGKNPSDLEAIKTEVAPRIRHFQPDSLPINYQIPIMSVGDDAGERIIRAEVKSEIFGCVYVEDVRIGDEWFRRLMLERFPASIQSQIPLQNNMDINKKRLIGGYETTALLILTAFQRMTGIKKSCLIIGLGGGTLVSALNRACGELMQMIVVEIDKLMVDLARRWFELPDIERNGSKILVTDGIKYIEQMAGDEQRKFDLIMFDVNTDELETNEFLTSDVLRNVRRLLTHHGVFVSNFLTRIANLTQDVASSLGNEFEQVEGIKDEECVNELFVCRQNKNTSPIKRLLSEPSLREYVRQTFPERIDDFFEYVDNLDFKIYNPS